MPLVFLGSWGSCSGAAVAGRRQLAGLDLVD